jgi:endonuclease/exonuclease/phosphatase (EEP) superfamily protein YafD
MITTLSHQKRIPCGSEKRRCGAMGKMAPSGRIALGLMALLMSGCIRIPDQPWTISHRNAMETRSPSVGCSAAGLGQSEPDRVADGRTTPLQTTQPQMLNAEGFQLVSWNTFKGRRPAWPADFRKLSQNADILILQEAYLSETLKEMLDHNAHHWDMSTAFAYRYIETGVLTASRIAASFTCAFREKEPLSRIPKSVLISRYPISGTARELLVANIHAINFSTHNSAFKRQTDRLERVLEMHQGPMIVAGDFNTWNANRMARVNAMARRLGLSPVTFDENRRSRIFGQNVDHVYYRGLEATHATTPIVSSSDHNPLMVVFKLAPKPHPGT